MVIRIVASDIRSGENSSHICHPWQSARCADHYMCFEMLTLHEAVPEKGVW